MTRRLTIFAAALAMLLPSIALGQAGPKLKALIVDGQNNHRNWLTTTKMMTKYLEDTALFTVEVATTAPQGADASYKPEFKKFDVVISNYNGADWPTETQAAFVDYVKNGGGFVVVHAANNAFGNWKEYNEMIGLGGWGGRNERSGPYVYLDAAGQLVRDGSPGSGGNHGPQHPFQIIVRDGEHPVTKGMPKEWMHVNDELYDKLRGPGEKMHILATAYSDPAKRGTGRHEPMIFTVAFGQGRVFHTPMGHGNDSQECVGFITTLVRGCQWAATGKVTLPIPGDFPTADKTSQRKFVE